MDHAVTTEAQFVRSNTVLAATALVPELRLHLASEITPIWEATEAELARTGLPPPFWAFAWAGGQALARHILDHPGIIAGRRVLDFASGSGIVALAAARAGAAVVAANEIDRFAAAAIALNAAANGLTVDIILADLIGRTELEAEVILAGDVCYEQPMAGRVALWLDALARTGRTVLMGDPGRTYLLGVGIAAVASYDVATTREIEDREVRRTTVWRVTG
ncbi:MAG: methyltransferase [Alphaproteobacteria bacterium]|nr:methyltransferase [Alphaproteobacteria bacterium]